MSERTPPREPSEPDENLREAEGEDPTSPARGFDSIEDLERHDAEAEGSSEPQP